MMSKGKLLIALPVFTGMALAIVGVHDHLVGDDGRIARIVATFVNPLAVLSGRSPGQRGFGTLLLTKRGHKAASGSPHERVLSAERERAPSNLPPGADNPFSPVAPRDVLNGPAIEQSYASGGRSPTSPFDSFPVGYFPGAFGNGPGGYSGIPIVPNAIATPSESPPLPASTSLSDQTAAFPSLAAGKDFIPDQIQVAPPLGPYRGGPDRPITPLQPPELGPGPTTVAVPEPPSWTILILALFIVVVLRRVQARALNAVPV
jgi:hypothetical protein